MLKTKIRHILMLLWLLSGLAGVSLQAKTIEKPVEEVGMCPDNLRYYWHGKTYTEPGTYTATETLPNGDIEKYTLVLYDMQLRSISATMLKGSQINVLGKSYTKDGIYYDTIFNYQGEECDILVRINIQYGEYFHEYDTIHMCDGDAYPSWHNKNINKPGTYFDKYKTKAGLDSIYQLTLIKHYSVEYWDTIYVCPPQKVYYLNGRAIYKDGDYTSDVKSPYGCDSIIHAHIVFAQAKEPTVHEIFFCGNITIIRYGADVRIDKQTSFFDTIPSQTGCDSIIETRYTPYPTQLFEEVQQIRLGEETVNWRGKTYSNVGVYYDSLKNQFDCDSIYRLRVVPTTESYFTVNTCAGERIELGNGFAITTDTVITDSLKNSYGGDSLVHTTYNFVQPFFMSQTITICSNQYVTWKGHIPVGQTEEIVLHEAGLYRDEHKTVDGCDSIYAMYVIVNEAYIKDTVIARCNDSLLVNPITWTDSKGVTHVWSEPNRDLTFRDTMSHTTTERLTFEDGSTGWDFNTGGCDSIINVRVVTGDFCSKRDVYYICDNGSVEVDGKTYTKPGKYYNMFTSYRNLGVQDSIHNFEIVQASSTQENRPLTLHQLQLPYTYEGERITEAGAYTIKLKNQYGCDSIINLTVTVKPTIIRPAVEHLICPDPQSYYEFPDGRKYNQPGTYLDTIYGGIDNNDTIVQITLKWADRQFYNESASFLHGGSYIWEGHKQNGVDRVFDQEGVYWDSCKNVSGCDSIYRLELSEAKPFFGVEDQLTICSSQLPYTWHNQSITEAGTYHDSLLTVFGLDSVWEVTIKVNQSYKEERQIDLCPGVEYIVDGQVITGDTYTETYTTKDGCDSVIIYYLNRHSLSRPEEIARFAENTVYTWRGMEFTHGGDYYDTIRTTRSFSTAEACDSVIYHLHLIEEHAYHYVTDSAVCLGSDEQVSWHGKLYPTSGTYYDSLTTKFGLDSVWQLNLVVNHDTVVQWHRSLCNGGAYDFFGHMLSEPGTYLSAPFPRTGTGCDSIIELILQPVSTDETVVNYVLCEGDFVSIGDSVVTNAGVYLDTLTSSLGCDSVVKYVVTVGKEFFFTEEKMINPGTTYPWHKDGQAIVLSQPGTYWDSCFTVHGCDSIYKLTLIWNQVEYIFPTDTDFICSADLPYVWHHKSLTETGLYYDSLQTNEGRDSVYSLYLTVYTTMHTQDVQHFCQGERPVINGIPYEKDAVFTDTLTSFTGCDSIVDYILHFHSKYAFSTTIYLHDGETYTLGDKVITSPGVYTHKFETQYGCDSVVTVNIKYCPNPEQITEYHNLCQGEHLTISGKVITTSGTYFETRTTVDGCDSIICHIVNVHTAYLFNTAATMCKGSSYTWRGKTFDQQGVYFDSLTTAHGCDSIYRLILNYKRTDLFDTIISVCQSDLPYKYKGKYYFQDSVFIDTLGVNTEGCDSILRWNYRINHHCSDYDQYSRCPGRTINIDGILVSAAGTYQQNHLTADGQDSLYRFTVHDVLNYEFTTEITGCDSIVHAGRTFYARGPGQETFNVDLHHSTIDDCDSLEHLILTIHMSSPAHVYSKTIADYDSVRFGPYYYNTTGEFALHYTNVKGCDSTEILQLTVLETEHPEIRHYFFCKGDENGLDIFGKHYYPTEEYTYISDTAWVAGKPIIRTADIVMQYPFTVTRFEPDNDQIVCSSHEVLFYVNYATKDASILPDYYDVDFNVGDIEAHPLHQEGKVDGKTTLPIMMGGQGKYVAPGYYSYRLRLRSESCHVSDTILEGSILVRYPSDIMESSWDDAVMLVNEKYNGGSWVFRPPYKWQVISAQGVDKTALVAGDITQPYLHSSELEEGDRIMAILMREGYGQAVPSCEYIFTPTLAVQPHAILVYPTAVQARRTVTIAANNAGAFRLYDYTGRTYTSGRFAEGETQVTMPAIQGCYIIVLEDEQGNQKTQKLIVY